MRAATAFWVPFVAALLAGLLVVGWWYQRSSGPTEPVDLAFGELSLDGPRYVRVSGVAHYESVITQKVQGGLVRGPQTFYLFGLFAEGDTDGRVVTVVVRTRRRPPPGISHEAMVVEAVLSEPGPLTVPPSTAGLMAKEAGYRLDAAAMLLEPVRLDAGGSAWIEL